MTEPILPGAALGVLGGGQLGRMFAIAAAQMGYEVVVFSPESDCPASQVSARTICAAYDDMRAVRDFARQVKVVTLEFENVPTATVEAIEAITPVRPGSSVLSVTQNRLREKDFLSDHGFPVTAYAPAEDALQVRAAVSTVGLPAVLKTTAMGYDGKGQRLVASADEAEAAFAALGAGQMVLESKVALDKELSVVGARGLDGSFASFGPIENRHSNHILDVSLVPADISQQVAVRAVQLTRDVLVALDVVGLLCVEFFLSEEGELLINELAPRPHNSGHYSIEACLTSQFEQQVRAITGLPLGSTEQIRPAAMANLLGDLWAEGEPDWTEVLGQAGISLHLYGKRQARPGRKMGHLTATAASVEEACRRVVNARRRLCPIPNS